jgi:N-acetylmuramoyl-L-alanine amidase
VHENPPAVRLLLVPRHCGRGAAAGCRRCRPWRKGYRRDQRPRAERIRLQPRFCRPVGEHAAPAGTGGQEVNFDGRIESLYARPQAANGSDFFISIHHDSIGEAWLLPWEWEGRAQTYTEVKRGYGIFVSAQNPALATSLRCASTIGAMMRRAGFAPSSWHARKHQPADAENGVWYYDNLVVLYRTRLPAVLFEAGVIKHRDEELELRDPERQARMADAVATGIAACLYVRAAE